MGRLVQIAEELYRTAAEIGIARYRLKRGLVLTLRRDNGDWVLSLGRENKAPGELEEQICLRAFGAPGEGVERATADIQGWQVVRFRWAAGQVSQLALMGPGEAGAYYREGR